MPIPRYSYVDGRYVLHQYATVHIEDRGYLFSDGVYEGINLINGKLLEPEMHFERLGHSLSVLSMSAPMSARVMESIIYELARRNRMKNGFVYLQITRGSARRNHAFPAPEAWPIMVITIHSDRTPPLEQYEKGVNALTAPDIRWGRRDAKTISLLPNILAKQYAVERDAKEALLVANDGYVTEGSASNAFIVTKGGTVKTHPEDEEILGGITRFVVLSLAYNNGIEICEEAFTLEELYDAEEVFITSTTMGVMPVVCIDGKKIASGKVGKTCKKLYQLYQHHVHQKC